MGIVHQDLKPSNIMVDGAGQAYIMDFGLARSFYRIDKGTQKTLTGTPKYMSPEQVRREKIDQRTDIYAFGTIMYEMLTEKHPFRLLPAIVSVAIIIALVIYTGRPQAAQTLNKGKRISLAVTYLTNNSGNEEFDYIGRSFVELLIADLLQSKYVKVITGTQLYGILDELGYLDKTTYSPEELQQVASRGSADYILAGYFTMAGEILRVDTLLYDSKIMEPVGSETVEGRGGDKIFPMVDRLSQLIKKDFNISQEDIYADIDKDVMSITTSSPEAIC